MSGVRTNGSQATHDGDSHASERLADVLGWASLGLGVPQTSAPERFAESIGVRRDDGSRFWTRMVGVRELAAAAGILALEKPRPVAWVWARVAGDVMDLALLGRAWQSKRKDAGRLAAAIGAVVGITAADVYTGMRLRREPEEHAERPEREAESLDMHVATSITVRRPRAEVYAFWHDFANLPTFMDHLETVVVIAGENRSRWTAHLPVGRSVEWEATVIDDVPDSLIAWESLEGSDVKNSGSVSFADAPGDRGTEIHLEMDYDAPGGPAGAMVAKLFGEDPTQQVRGDMRRFKQVMETGEIVRSDSTPEGPGARGFFKQRPAQPVEQPVGAGASGGSVS
jgi:uncharacterized membrane protein